MILKNIKIKKRRWPLLWISDIFASRRPLSVPDRNTTLCCGFQLSPILFSSFSVLLRAQSRSNSFGFGRPIFGLVYANTHAGPYVDRNTEDRCNAYIAATSQAPKWARKYWAKPARDALPTTVNIGKFFCVCGIILVPIIFAL